MTTSPATTPPATDRPPAPEGPTATFWRELAAGRFRYQRCHSCGQPFHRPRVLCPACGSSDWQWCDSAGLGRVYSVTTVHIPPPGFADEAPYALALVDLDEGVRAFGRVVGRVPEIGERVRLVPDTDPSGAARVAFEAVEEPAAAREVAG